MAPEAPATTAAPPEWRTASRTRKKSPDTATARWAAIMFQKKGKRKMEYARGAGQAYAGGGLTMLRFGFDFPRLLSEQGRQFFEQVASLNTGLGDFLLRQGNRTIETATRLTQCKSLPEAFLLQAQWMRDAADDYTKEAARMAEIQARMFGGFWDLKGFEAFFRADHADPPFTSARRAV